MNNQISSRGAGHKETTGPSHNTSNATILFPLRMVALEIKRHYKDNNTSTALRTAKVPEQLSRTDKSKLPDH
jgi:hypothetical protein